VQDNEIVTVKHHGTAPIPMTLNNPERRFVFVNVI